ncbi:MAG TPA: ComEC/Rec2 family competence protein [Tepidiformaceae bacterium]|nr:ComEC/Rec2 family competence protein [Tepidiformaceae bacterium]
MTLVLLAVAELAAIAAVALAGFPGWFGGAVLVLAMPALWALGGRRVAAWGVAAAVIALAGGMRFEAWHDAPPPPLAAYLGETVTIDGVIASEADPGQTTVRYRVDARSFGDGTPTGGGVLVTLPQYTEHLPGERVRVRGELVPAPTFDSFDYQEYLERHGIVGTMLYPRIEPLAPAPGGWRRTRAEVRSSLDRAVRRALPEPEASLASGIAFGRDDTLPGPLYDDFRTTGLAHLVAVSGSNVMLLAMLAFAIAVPVMGRRWSTLPAAALVLVYVVVAGGGGSVLRAAAMAGVLLFGRRVGRPASALPALAAAAVVLVTGWPWLAADAGFQLSLAATAGIVVFAPWIDWALREGVDRARAASVVPRLVTESASLTLAATIATAPIVAVTFGQVSVIGLVANVIGAPLFVVALPLAGMTALAGVAWEPAGWAVGLVAHYPLAAVVAVAEQCARVPAASVTVEGLSPAAATAAGLGLVAAGGAAYRWLAPDRRPPRFAKRARMPLAGAAGVAVVAAVWAVSLRDVGGPGVLRIDVLDIGQGDAILVTTPEGRRVLVDGGPSGIELARELGAVMPHWQRGLDVVVVTHSDQDHTGGLPAAMDRFNVRRAFEGGHGTRGGTGPLAFAAPRRTLERGDWWEMDGVRFEVLWPPAAFDPANTNDASVVLRVRFGETVALLTGDIEAGVQNRLVAAGDIRADVLKVPHHGSKTSSAAFFRAVGAEVAIISAGANNRYGHPAGETLAALAPARIVRTDTDGRVRIESDGSSIRVRVEREPERR